MGMWKGVWPLNLSDYDGEIEGRLVREFLGLCLASR